MRDVGPLTRPAGRAPRLLVGLLTATLLLAACAPSTPPTSNPSGSGAGSPGEKVALEYWSWAPGVEKNVALWNSTHPDVQVTFTRLQGGQTGYPKMRAALQAGNAPDLVQVEYEKLTEFAVDGSLEDITPYVAKDSAQFPEWTWRQVSPGGQVLAIPEDTGPVAMMYNQKLFDQYGLTVPKTWADFRAAAEKLHRAAPDKKLTTFVPDGSWVGAMAWQNGAKWFGTEGDAWRVNINGPETKQVADYWQRLVDDKLVDVDPGFNPGWFKKLDNGEVASTLAGAWMPLLLSTNMKKTKGDWRVALLPQWGPDKAQAGNWGGSTTAVLKGSKHAEAAAQFAVWLSTDPASLDLLIKNCGCYPAATAGTQRPAMKEANAFFGGQPVFDVFAQALQQVDTSWTWGPSMSDTYTAIGDGLGTATAKGGSFSGVLDTAQAKTVQNLQSRGLKTAS